MVNLKPSSKKSYFYHIHVIKLTLSGWFVYKQNSQASGVKSKYSQWSIAPRAHIII